MPYYLFVWTEDNEEHVNEHGITMDEFEAVVRSPDEVKISRTTGRPIAFGETATGRYIACVYELIDETTVYPITAYEID